MKIPSILTTFCSLLLTAATAQSPGAWETQTIWSKVYYVDGNAADAADDNPGTKTAPFKTISKAARVLRPGEKVVIAGGIYRECIQPARGGEGPDKMIGYEAAPGQQVIIKGSAEIRDGWKKSDGWTAGTTSAGTTSTGMTPAGPAIWQVKLDGSLFDGYNPFGMENIPGNRYWLNFQNPNHAAFFRRRGMVFVDGKPLEQVEQYSQLTNPGIPLSAYSRTTWQPLFTEFSGKAGSFWVENNGAILHIRLANDDDPRHHTIEVTVKEQLFAPAERYLGYIHIKKLHFVHAGNGFPVPQHGMVSTGRGHHWIFEDNVFEWANSVALDIGKESWDATTPAIPGYHIIRNNTIRYAGICGIAGPVILHTLVENNLLEWIGWQDIEHMAESGAIKFHYATGLLCRRNTIRHIRYAAGLWLDVGNKDCRISGNLFADIACRAAAIVIEATHDSNTIDHNIVWNTRPGHEGETDFNANGIGILLLGTDHTLISHNLLAHCTGPGVFSVAVEGRVVDGRGGTARQNTVNDNLFFNGQAAAIEFSNPHNTADGNYYANMPPGCLRVDNPPPYQLLDLPAWQDFYGWDKKGGQTAASGSLDADKLIWTFNISPLAGQSKMFAPFLQAGKKYDNVSIDPRTLDYIKE